MIRISAWRWPLAFCCGVVLAAQTALGSGLTSLTPPARHRPAFIDVMPEARVFTLKVHGNRLVVADQGPKNGPPVLVVPGFSADFPYLSPFVNELSRRGCRVFIYNPQGQGGARLASTGSHRTLGMAGLIQTVLDMHAYIRTQTRAPVTWVGHSLGGMETRMASLYVEPSEVRALITLFSPSIMFAKADAMNPIFVYERLVNEQIFSNELINAWTLGIYDWWRLESAKLMFVEAQNGLLKGLLGAPHPNREALKANAAYFIDWKASPEILSDLENAVFKWTDGADLVKAWINRKPTIPVLSFSADDDGVISSDDVVKEAQAMKYPNTRLPVGHIGAFYDTDINPKLAARVSELAKGRRP